MDLPRALNESLKEFLQRVDYSVVEDSVRVGWDGKSLGIATHQGTWLRVVRYPLGHVNERLLAGYLEAEAIVGVRKPRVLHSWSWVADNCVWQVLEMTKVEGRILGAGPDNLANPVILPEAWWASLDTSLSRLNETSTTRQGITQDYVSRRLVAAINLPLECTIVPRWSTAHRDLHWSNVTDAAEILDWESWGISPAGFDVATLWASSLDHPRIAADVLARLSHPPDTSFVISQLLACEEILRRHERTGGLASLARPARAAMQVLAKQLLEVSERLTG